MRISVSQLKAYKACRRLYELSYIEKLKYNKPIAALETGSNYHSKVESINNCGDFERTLDVTDAMAVAYKKHIFPFLKVVKAEEWFEREFGKHILIGRFDGIAEDGSLVEHKTTSGDVGEEYLYNLQWDDQTLFYMLSKGVNALYHTVIKKPTIRQKQGESIEEFIKRCEQWYDVDTSRKIGLFKIVRSNEEIVRYAEQLKLLLDEIENTTIYFKNPCHCQSWGRRCEYSQICLNYNPNEDYIDFTKKTEV